MVCQQTVLYLMQKEVSKRIVSGTVQGIQQRVHFSCSVCMGSFLYQMHFEKRLSLFSTGDESPKIDGPSRSYDCHSEAVGI